MQRVRRPEWRGGWFVGRHAFVQDKEYRPTGTDKVGRPDVQWTLKAYRNEKNRDDFLLFTMVGRTNTLYSSPLGTYGILATHVRIHCPSTRTSQVPHSPLPHLNLTYCPACAATALSGCP